MQPFRQFFRPRCAHAGWPSDSHSPPAYCIDDARAYQLTPRIRALLLFGRRSLHLPVPRTTSHLACIARGPRPSAAKRVRRTASIAWRNATRTPGRDALLPWVPASVARTRSTGAALGHTARDSAITGTRIVVRRAGPTLRAFNAPPPRLALSSRTPYTCSQQCMRVWACRLAPRTTVRYAPGSYWTPRRTPCTLGAYRYARVSSVLSEAISTS
ncbi:hypothetical protein OH77DRAFT_1244524 [Trametes cingulata]|nr:hypothetical protein OH77DRAFT_1244524 [Trametes cingulata]